MVHTLHLFIQCRFLIGNFCTFENFSVRVIVWLFTDVIRMQFVIVIINYFASFPDEAERWFHVFAEASLRRFRTENSLWCLTVPRIVLFFPLTDVSTYSKQRSPPATNANRPGMSGFYLALTCSRCHSPLIRFMAACTKDRYCISPEHVTRLKHHYTDMIQERVSGKEKHFLKKNFAFLNVLLY